jgi:hypothetical protein
MERLEHVSGRLVAFGGALLAIAALLLIAVAQTASPAFAEPHPGLNFTASVPGYAGCNTSQGDAQCYIPPGTTFTVNVTLDPLPSDIPSYQGFDIKMSYTGLTSADNASTASWPDCGYPASYFEAGLVNMGCAVGLPPAGPSTYTGLVGTNDFTCSQSGAITLLHGDGNTDLIQDTVVVLGEVGPSEILNITCGSPPTATTVPTATPLPRLTASGSAGSLSQADNHAMAQWLLIGSLMSLAAASLVVLGWKSARSR